MSEPTIEPVKRPRASFAKRLSIGCGTILALFVIYFAFLVVRAHWIVNQEMQAIRSMLPLGFRYLQFCHEEKRSPHNLEELRQFDAPLSFQEDAEALERVLTRVQLGELIVIWDAVLPEDPDSPNFSILAYESQVPTRGGWIIDSGAAVRQLTAERFRTTPLVPQTKE